METLEGNRFSGGNSFEHIHDAMKPVVNHISNISGVGQTVFLLEAKLVNSMSLIEYEVPIIGRMDIIEQFETDICDYIEMDIQIPIHMHADITRNYKDLKCQLHAYSYDTTSDTKSALFFELNWDVVIPKRGDMYKTATPKTIEEVSGGISSKDKLMNLTIQLYHPESIALRSKKMFGIFRDQTVTKMIHYLAALFGVKTIDLTRPDNEDLIENFIIEPAYYINDVFDYIQDRYGVYTKGLSIYFFGLTKNDSRLVVYPKYNSNPDTKDSDSTVEIMYIGQGNMLGTSTSYYQFPTEGSDINFNGRVVNVKGLKIICNDVLTSGSKSDIGADHIGTMSIYYQANRTLDRWRKTSVDTKNLAIPSHNMDVLEGLKETKEFVGFSTAHYNPRYEISFNNVYKLASNLAQYNSDTITARWNGAMPWKLFPGQKIIFTYSVGSELKLMQVPAICSGVAYTFSKLKSIKAGVNAFSCDATYSLNLTRQY